MRAAFFLFCCIIWGITKAFAQEYSYTHYDTKDGLAGSTVYGMAQSADGFMWFGTETGLSRFDGQRFKTFTVADGLPANEILGIFNDSRGRLWFTPFGHSISYYYRGKIHNPANDSILRKIVTRAILNSVAEDSEGTIILQSAYETYAIRANNEVISYPYGLLDVQAMFSRQYAIINSKSVLLPELVVLPANVRTYMRPYWVFINAPLSSRDKYYLFSYRDTARLITASGDLKNIPMPPKASVMTIDTARIAFYDSKGGIVLLNKDSESIRQRYFKDYTIQDVMKDRENNLWFSTKGSGVFKVSNNRFKNLFALNDNGTTYIRDIQKIGPYIYVGGHNDKYWKFNAVQDDFFDREISNKPQPFLSGRSFLQSLPDHTFINCGSSDFLNLKQYGFEPLSTAKTAQVLGDTLLVAGYSGAYVLNRKTGLGDTLYKGRTTCGYRQGNIYYIGTLNGLYAIGPGKTKTFLGAVLPQFGQHISALTSGAGGILWVGTYGSGILGYKDGKIVARFNQDNGLSNNLCRCLFYTQNTLWAGTGSGLNKIDVTPGVYKVIRKITADDGLNSNVINAIYNDGNIVYAGTPIGVTVFKEQNIATHSIPEVVMTGITISGRAVDPLQKHMRLPHKDNNITFEYSGISFLSGKDITFKYRILGLDDRWQTTSDQVLNYPSLPSGSYTLQLVAVNKFRDESKPWAFQFVIEKRLSETIGFRVALGLMAILLIVVIVVYIIRRGHRQASKDLATNQKMILLEQMALRAQMNPHFIFNCLNAMQHYILDGDIKKANFYLSRFAALVRETLDNATKTFITIEEEINYLTSYIELERLQIRDRFDYTITVSPGIDRQKMKIPNMVLQPYIENAIKHGLSPLKQGGLLSVTFHLPEQGRVLECIITDNGAGIGSSSTADQIGQKKFPSKGMSITDKRIQTLNQLHQAEQAIQIRIEDTGAGTRITIHFPIHYD